MTNFNWEKDKKLIRVVVAGGFDPFHIGHLRHIIEARELGDELIVILARDDQLKHKKGYSFMPYLERKEILEHIKEIDKVIENRDIIGTICAETLKYLKPDIFAKGGDRIEYTMPQEEIDICQKYNIKIQYGVGKQLSSSSLLVKRAMERIS